MSWNTCSYTNIFKCILKYTISLPSYTSGPVRSPVTRPAANFGLCGQTHRASLGEVHNRTCKPLVNRSSTADRLLVNRSSTARQPFVVIPHGGYMGFCLVVLPKPFTRDFFDSLDGQMDGYLLGGLVRRLPILPRPASLCAALSRPAGVKFGVGAWQIIFITYRCHILSNLTPRHSWAGSVGTAHGGAAGRRGAAESGRTGRRRNVLPRGQPSRVPSKACAHLS